LPLIQHSHVDAQALVDLLPNIGIPPSIEVVRDRLPRREIVRQHAPGAATPSEVEDSVDDFTQWIDSPPAFVGARLGKELLNNTPLSIRDITGVTHPCIHSGSLQHLPTWREDRFLDAL
jgi:hypothetical protein